MQIIGSAKAGDTFQLVVQYKSKIIGNCAMTLQFPKKVAPLDKTQGETTRTDTMSIGVADSLYTRVYQMKAFSAGASYLELSMLHLSTPNDYNPISTQYIEIVHEANSYKVVNGQTDSADVQYCTYGELMQVTKKKQGLQQTYTYTVNVSGSVTYLRERPSTLIRGVAGAEVRFYFGLKNNPNMLWHPIVGGGNRGTEGTHYGKCDNNGNYNISFTFTTNYDIKDYVNKVILRVSKTNDAISIIKSISGSYVLNGPDGSTLRTFGASQELELNYGGSNNISINGDIIVNRDDGAALRLTQLSREFALAKDNSLSLPILDCVIDTTAPDVNGNGIAGFFDRTKICQNSTK